VWVGYSEELAHRLTAGADAFVMPSRFEPCGLNQMYSLRFGTVPIVRRTGGLADTVIDATPENLRSDLATGFTFDAPSVDALWGALDRSLNLWASRADGRWAKLVTAGMRHDFGWERGATAYHALYRRALGIEGPPPAASGALQHHEARP
jgi:starch synthase